MTGPCNHPTHRAGIDFHTLAWTCGVCLRPITCGHRGCEELATVKTATRDGERVKYRCGAHADKSRSVGVG